MPTPRNQTLTGTSGTRLLRGAKLRIVITAGPTREYFDTVRFVSNASTGRMGFAIAEAAARAGHLVTLVSGPVEISPPAGSKVIRVETADQMLVAAQRAFKNADAAIFTAAVCDFRPARRSDKKLPKAKMATRMQLVRTPDIAATLGRQKGSRVTIAFALEDHNGHRHAEAKLARKNCDAIVLNGPANVGSERATAEFLVHNGTWQKWKPGSKAAIARRIIRELEKLHSDRSTKRKTIQA